jgi:plastocyanin domain-containing protein
MKIKYLAILAILFAGTVQAETPEYQVVIKDHRFSPSNIDVPAGQKVKLIVENQDPTPEEFESHDLNREKIVPGGSKIIIYVGPLEAGSYKFFGEFNPKTAHGTLTVK